MIEATTTPSGVTLIELGEMRLTAANAPQFKQALLGQIDEGHMRLVLDLKSVSFIDSTGLGALVGVLKRLGARGDMAVCGLQSATQQMFKLTRMDRVFRIFNTADEALDALEQS